LKKIFVLISLLFSLSSCNSKNGDNLLSTYATSSQEIESPDYINESMYSGNEIEIIRLINQRMKYTFEENESEYMKLFHATSPINGLPKYKLKTVKLIDKINIQEQKYSFVAQVKVEDVVITGEAFNNNYVFIKAKNSNDGWKIGDID